MNDPHPVDDLFSRSLRNAEAPPPPETWQEIARHLDQEEPRSPFFRRFGTLLALAFVAGGTILYLSHSRRMKTVGMAALAAPSRQPAEPTAAIPAESASHVLAPRPPKPLALVEDRDGSSNRPSYNGSVNPPASKRRDRPAAARRATHQRSDRTTGASNALSQRVSAHPAFVSDAAATSVTGGQVQQVGGAVHLATTTAGPTAQLPFPWEVARMTPRWSLEPGAGPSSAITGRPAAPYVLSKATHWLGIEVGQYRERRTWYGGDHALAQALTASEAVHHPSSAGLYFGTEGRSGWGLSGGLVIGTARFGFHHVDQVLVQRDSLVPSVITFNSQVISSFIDTVSTFSEAQRPVTAENRYVFIRVPIEVSWHRPWGRWLFGMRTGLAVELGTMRSGFTLERNASDGGWHAVDLSSTPERHSTLSLAGGAWADVGWTFSEQWSLWASPGFSGGLLPLGAGTHAAHFLPQRLGLRIRLAYSLHP